MTEGINTFKGLAVPLNGESEIKQLHIAYDMLTLTSYASNTSDFLVLQDSDGTECFAIDYRGVTDLVVTATSTVYAFDVRLASSSTTGSNVAGNFQNVLGAVSINGAQCFGLRVHLDTSSAVSMGGGREAALCLYMKGWTSALGHGHSMIVVDDAGTKVNSLFNFLNIGTCAGMIVEGPTDGVGTHAIRVYIAEVPYYIMITSCDPR